jgi:hypothetical protein
MFEESGGGVLLSCASHERIDEERSNGSKVVQHGCRQPSISLLSDAADNCFAYHLLVLGILVLMGIYS